MQGNGVNFFFFKLVFYKHQFGPEFESIMKDKNKRWQKVVEYEGERILFVPHFLIPEFIKMLSLIITFFAKFTIFNKFIIKIQEQKKDLMIAF